MSHRFKLLFIICLTYFSVVPQALAGVVPQPTSLTESDRIKSDRTSNPAKDVLAHTILANPILANPTSELSIVAFSTSASSPAASETPLSAASPTATLSPSPTTSSPIANSTSFPAWLWWGAIGLVPIAVVMGVLYTLHLKEHGQKEHGQTSMNQKAKIAFPTVVDGSSTVDQKAQDNRKNEQSGETLPDILPGMQTNTAQSIAPDQLNLPVSTTTRLAKVDIVVALIHDLYHSDATQRRKAIWELGQRGDSRAIQPLVELLIDSDSHQRGLILAAVTEISIRTLKPINRALLLSIQDNSPDVRKNAIRDATRVFELVTQASQLLQYAATSDADADVQSTAEWALGQLNRMRPALAADGAPNLANQNKSSVDLPSLIENPNVEISRHALEQTEVSKG